MVCKIRANVKINKTRKEIRGSSTKKSFSLFFCYLHLQTKAIKYTLTRILKQIIYYVIPLKRMSDYWKMVYSKAGPPLKLYG